MNVERDIRFELISRLCPNATGAELRSVCTEAGMFAIRFVYDKLITNQQSSTEVGDGKGFPRISQQSHQRKCQVQLDRFLYDFQLSLHRLM
jgi:SpoVK/Ycf46/Vps4 family AAA+-type ATPase